MTFAPKLEREEEPASLKKTRAFHDFKKDYRSPKAKQGGQTKEREGEVVGDRN